MAVSGANTRDSASLALCVSSFSIATAACIWRKEYVTKRACQYLVLRNHARANRLKGSSDEPASTTRVEHA